MNRAWKAAMELLDTSTIRRDDPATAFDVAHSMPTGPWPEGPGSIVPGGDYAVRRIIEELARARALADQLASRLARAATPSSPA
ncbi:hypothetical protein [Promicromonospora sp. NPDC059942]|uniref:hypothetical protein n=1 Tax=Promicromonospora sp. NPDC059942 TaxID=3347009 RepID=UPI0036490A73